MQLAEIKSLGFKLTKSVPASVEEFDQLAKESGAALREANRNVLYRSTLATFRNAFLHGTDAEEAVGKEGKEGEAGYVAAKPAVEGLDKLTGIERFTKVTKPEVKDAEGKITQEEVVAWSETEDDFFTRVCATLVKNGEYSTTEAAQSSFQSLAQSVLDSIDFDPSKTERKSAGPKKTPNTYLEVAKEIVTATGSLENAIASFERKTSKKVAGTTLEDLAKAVWEDQKAQKKQIANSYANS